MSTFSDTVSGLFGSSDEDTTLPSIDKDLETVLELIQNERRRLVIQMVSEIGDDTISLRDLAKRIAAFENDVDRSRLQSGEYKAVYVGLYQVHLPRLAEDGLIQYDSDRGDIARSGLTEDVADLIHELEVAVGGEA